MFCSVQHENSDGKYFFEQMIFVLLLLHVCASKWKKRIIILLECRQKKHMRKCINVICSVYVPFTMQRKF